MRRCVYDYRDVKQLVNPQPGLHFVNFACSMPAKIDAFPLGVRFMSHCTGKELPLEEMEVFDRLKKAALYANKASDVIAQWFPIDNQPWLLQSADESTGFTTIVTVFDCLRFVEKGVNPNGCERSPYRIIAGFMIETPIRYLQLMTAFRALLHIHDLVVSHYGWEKAVISDDSLSIINLHHPRLYPDGPQWKWPNVPKIPMILITGLRRAAEALWKETTSLLPSVAPNPPTVVPGSEELVEPALNRTPELIPEIAQEGISLPQRMTVAKANAKSMTLARKMREGFFALSQRQQAELIGCSWSTWKKTPFYQKAQVKRPAGTGVKMSSPKTVSLTSGREAVMGEGGKDEVLNNLIAEQKKDKEPSPLEDALPGRLRRIHSRKRL